MGLDKESNWRPKDRREMEREVSMALAQHGGDPSSPGALAHPQKLGCCVQRCCRLGCPSLARLWHHSRAP